MKTWDAIIVGGGIIGLTLAIELRKRGIKVLVVERGEPGREASHAAAGMLADLAIENPPALQPLATASAKIYPEFVHELQDESGMNVDLRGEGTLFFCSEKASVGEDLSAPLSEMEPAVARTDHRVRFLRERSVDPRALTAAALKAAKHREVDFVTGSAVEQVLVTNGRVSGAHAGKTTYSAPVVINCAGAWAGKFPPVSFPVRPMKGQMLCVVAERGLLRHVVRAPEVYLVPRTDGRILIGSTVEDVGYDKRTVPETIQRLHQAAIALVPALAEARMIEAWAGLRPASPDGLPLLGETAVPGYFVATGHFRDGILLAPITAKVIGQVVAGERPEVELGAYAAGRLGG